MDPTSPVDSTRRSHEAEDDSPPSLTNNLIQPPTETRADRSISQRLLESTVRLSSSLLSDPEVTTFMALGSEGSSKGSYAGPSNSRTEAPHPQRTVSDKARIVDQQYTSQGVKTSEGSFGEFLGGQTTEHTDVIGKGKATVYPLRSERTVDEQERLDGGEVTALLSCQTALCLPDNVDFGLSAPGMPHLREALFNDSKSSTLPWEHMLNFWPQDDPSSNVHPVPPASAQRSNISSTLWFRQWKDVLTRYNDEVWGELAPDVAKAREEVDAAENLGTVDTVSGLESLHRLQQILAHLRGSQL
ncbi:hypothetical protein jhhlp_006470 [Lomentospora prolificans]|uniref:Uncharacterized protein n=1 Tax=Lomentospora prolificans TaxID=41688 RepID=A0A2N3N659_9PEZI|nr:hypothetical protein jhhlp_006470 [Lomentospora prolificans]